MQRVLATSCSLNDAQSTFRWHIYSSITLQTAKRYSPDGTNLPSGVSSNGNILLNKTLPAGPYLNRNLRRLPLDSSPSWPDKATMIKDSDHVSAPKLRSMWLQYQTYSVPTSRAITGTAANRASFTFRVKQFNIKLAVTQAIPRGNNYQSEVSTKTPVGGQKQYISLDRCMSPWEMLFRMDSSTLTCSKALPAATRWKGISDWSARRWPQYGQRCGCNRQCYTSESLIPWSGCGQQNPREHFVTSWQTECEIATEALCCSYLSTLSATSSS